MAVDACTSSTVGGVAPTSSDNNNSDPAVDPVDNSPTARRGASLVAVATGDAVSMDTDEPGCVGDYVRPRKQHGT